MKSNCFFYVKRAPALRLKPAVFGYPSSGLKRRPQRLLLALSVFLFSSCATIKVADYDFSKELSPEQIRIVQISDFHSNDFGKNEQKLINKVQAANPDVIFLTGDIFDFETKKAKPTENVRLLLQGLQKIAPFFYITGNHEYYKYHNAEWSYLIEEYGGTCLQNQTVLLKLNAGTIEITGISDPFEDLTVQERLKDKDVKERYIQRLQKVSEKAMEIKNQNKSNPDFLFSVLLAHRPEYIREYLKYDYDLILSGHAHGGQWRFPGAKNGLYAPMQGMFPKYSGGAYEYSKEGTVFVISRGLSYQRPNLPRLFNPPELVVIELK